MVTEQIYRRLCYGASEAADSTIRPKLEIFKSGTGIQDNQQNTQKIINIYPNPANDLVCVETMNSSDAVLIELYGVDGRLIYTKETTDSKTNIYLSNFNNGVYFVKVTSGGKQTTKKLIVNH